MIPHDGVIERTNEEMFSFSAAVSKSCFAGSTLMADYEFHGIGLSAEINPTMLLEANDREYE